MRRQDGSADEIINLQEWTLRSVYTHLFTKSNDSFCMTESMCGKLYRLAEVVENMLYTAPARKAKRRRVDTKDLQASKLGIQNFMMVSTQLLRFQVQRDKIQHPEDYAAGGGGEVGGAGGGRRRQGGGTAISTLAGKLAKGAPATSQQKDLAASEHRHFG